MAQKNCHWEQQAVFYNYLRIFVKVMNRKTRQRLYERSERERKSPWNVVSFVLFVAIATVGVILSLDRRPSFRSGDLIFQAGGDGEMSRAIEESTKGNYTHVGIIERSGDSLFVLEATPRKGVTRTPFKEFADSSAHDTEGRPAIAVYRIKHFSKALKDSAIARAHRYLGRPYDFFYTPGADSLYCSELVWEVFLDADGSHIFPRIPMNFKGPDGAIYSYWVELYSRLGRSVPQDEPGTNPNDLSKSEGLKQIY